MHLIAAIAPPWPLREQGGGSFIYLYAKKKFLFVTFCGPEGSSQIKQLLNQTLNLQTKPNIHYHI